MFEGVSLLNVHTFVNLDFFYIWVYIYIVTKKKKY